MNEIIHLLDGRSGVPAQLVSWLVLVQAVLKAVQPILSHGATALADRLDDMMDRGRNDGALLLGLVRSPWWQVLAFLSDLAFRVKLPSAAGLEARWERIEKDKDKANPGPDATGLRSIAALLLLLPLLMVGCGTPEQTAYRTIGGTVHTVDAAMSAWGDWVRAGRATAQEEASVKLGYLRYQAAMRATESLVLAAKAQPDGAPASVAVPAILSSAAADLVALINQFSPPQKR